jgi:hypothetical protein
MQTLTPRTRPHAPTPAGRDPLLQHLRRPLCLGSPGLRAALAAHLHRPVLRVHARPHAAPAGGQDRRQAPGVCICVHSCGGYQKASWHCCGAGVSRQSDIPDDSCLRDYSHERPRAFSSSRLTDTNTRTQQQVEAHGLPAHKEAASRVFFNDPYACIQGQRLCHTPVRRARPSGNMLNCLSAFTSPGYTNPHSCSTIGGPASRSHTPPLTHPTPPPIHLSPQQPQASPSRHRTTWC